MTLRRFFLRLTAAAVSLGLLWPSPVWALRGVQLRDNPSATAGLEQRLQPNVGLDHASGGLEEVEIGSSQWIGGRAGQQDTLHPGIQLTDPTGKWVGTVQMMADGMGGSAAVPAGLPESGRFFGIR